MTAPILAPSRSALPGPVRPRRPIRCAGQVDRNLFTALFPDRPKVRRGHGAIFALLRNNPVDPPQIPPDGAESGNNRR